MRSALLLGRDHHTIGALAAISEGPAAITLTRGGAAKTYPHTEFNEDAVLFALGPGGACVAVADGHHGASGSQAVLAYLEAEWAARWTGEEEVAGDEAWRHEALRTIGGANHALLAGAAERGRPPAPTTLAIAVVRPRAGLLLWAGMGDSHVFAIGDDATTDVLAAAHAGRRPRFLGYEAQTADRLAEQVACGTDRLADLRAVALATDGLSETGIGVADPPAAVAEAARACQGLTGDLRALELAKGISRAAMTAQSSNGAGDNVASAAIWLAP